MPRIEVSDEEMHKLIDLVRRNPVLYDPTHKDYKDTCHIEHAWNRITMKMARPDMTTSDWRKKWVNRRDTYVKKKRHIRIHRSPSAVERAKRWRFFDKLGFLDRFFEGSTDSVESSAAANEEDSSEAAISGDEDPDEPRDEPICVAARQKSESSKRPAQTSTSSPCATPSKKKALDPERAMPVPTSLTFNGTDDVAQESPYVTIMSDPMDPHLADHYHHTQNPTPTRVNCPDYHLLFQSYAHRLERLPERAQSFIQFQIAQLFFNAENPDLPPMSIIPLPPASTFTSSSSSSSSSFRHQRRRTDDARNQQQQLQQQQQRRPDGGVDDNLESEDENDDVGSRTSVKVEQA